MNPQSNLAQASAASPIPFIDLKAQQRKLRPEIDAALKRVLDHGKYIMGPEVLELEEQLAQFSGAKHVISCASGTDALLLGLMAQDVKPGDAILLPSFTFAATAEVVALLGATPIFVDSREDTYNLCIDSLEEGTKAAKDRGLNLVGIIAVDLFGQPADYNEIIPFATRNNLWLLCDSAQSFGAKQGTQNVGTIGQLTTTSFFPAKPLGCYGDGGAIFTNDDDLASKMRSMRVHGKGSDKYDNIRIGINGRLDTLQAAILIEKLKVFPQELEHRQKIADIYTESLNSFVSAPFVPQNTTSAWAQYTIQLSAETNREKLMANLKDLGIPSVVYYVKPLHLQTAYQDFPTATGKGLPNCEGLSKTVLSLPMSGYLSENNAAYIVKNLVLLLG